MTNNDILQIRQFKNRTLEYYLSMKEIENVLKENEDIFSEQFDKMTERQKDSYSDYIIKLRKEKEVYESSFKQSKDIYITLLARC